MSLTQAGSKGRRVNTEESREAIMQHQRRQAAANECRRYRAAALTAAAVAAMAMLISGPVLAAGNATKGAKLAKQWCNGCHTVGASGTARKFDPGPMFAELAKKSPKYLEAAINKPHDFMPKFPTLSKQDKQDLIAYIRTVK
jgi:mono/diheme cytochrome c family protein